MNKFLLYILLASLHLHVPEALYGTISTQINQKISNIESLINLESEIAHLSQLFDGTRKGFADFVNKDIRISYKHILAPEFNLTKSGKLRFSGFHHDINQIVEKSDLMNITNKVIGEHEIYTANVWCGDIKYSKTFFPSGWPREKVISKIMEAYDNFIREGAKECILEPNGKYKIESLTNEGIKIVMIVTKNGEMITAYPLMREKSGISQI